MGWHEIPNGNSSYFYNDETRESSYVIPHEILSQKIAQSSSAVDQARSQTLSTASRGSPTARSPVINEKKAEQRRISLAAVEAWTVQIHPDSGTCYYENIESKELCWSDPFYADEDGGLDENMEEGEEGDNTTEAEKLSGYELAPSHNNLRHPEAKAGSEKFLNFLEKESIEITEDDGIRLKFPEYVQMKRVIDEKQSAVVEVQLPQAHTDINKISLSVLLGSTVGDLLNTVFDKFKKKTGKELDKGGTGRYVFKVCGYLDYMLHSDFKVGFFDHILFCLRKRIKIELELVKLSPADQMDLGPTLGMSVEEELRIEEEKLEVHTDQWKKDRDTRKREIRKMDNVIMQDAIKWPFRCLVRGVVDCPGEEMGAKSLRLEIGLYYGGELIGPTAGGRQNLAPNTQPMETLKTPFVPYSTEPSWPGLWLSSTKHEVALLPPSTRVGFMLYGTVDQKEVPLAGVCITLVDYNNLVLTGEKALKLWPHQKLQVARDPELANPKCERMPHLVNLASGVVGENEECDAGVLHVVFDSYATPVYANFPVLDEPSKEADGPKLNQFKQEPSEDDKANIKKLSRTDPLHVIPYTDKHLLWLYRDYCSTTPELLPKFLLCVNWGSTESVCEARKMLQKWRKYPAGREVEYLEMLDIIYSDPVTREFICRQLNRMDDYQFDQYMLQMVQCLKYEPYHDSPLARMLLRRALQSPYKIGHNFYWLLRSEMHNGDICARYGTILKTYIKRCGPHRTHLRRQITVNDMIQVVAEDIKSLPKAIRSKTAQEKLKKVASTFPPKFQICLSPRIECRGLKCEKTKVMSSKKMPLMLWFDNADQNGEDYIAIFKAGDDLRQDLMTLQLLRIMDTFWTQNGLDLRLNPYMCCATGHDLGMIEVVKNSDTTARIQVQYGGKNMGAWRNTPIDQFLKDNNKGTQYFDAVQNFVHTCAGYCVATYVLGIGDRHADNIMVTEKGHLFHIDFGHFLGNFKSKFGYKRERAPFVFTPEMAYVMGNRETTFGFPDLIMKDKEPRIGFPEFEQMCCQSYNVLREHSNLLMNLFILVTPAAMPELLEKTDVTYLKEMLSCDMTKEQADKKFKNEIAKSLSTVSRRFDNWIHNMKHG
ncbi:hypothetical protein TrVE_jg7505 [Triparma verrucosa]|uniref:phosphatidylinositol 3-kinase n=2 Tax=Triparma TaxID=722752 RepID=A0A9W7ASP3_9STRA|nr:hypothetical protein TrST_g7970 [Triparma strigata]GMI12325.1 hypothetical protein TrVE_jg7505 [Triparma verrucosa]